MKRAPVFPPKVFHRIRPTDPRQLDAMIASRSTSIVTTADALKFKRGHGLVVASWESFDEFTPAKVHALGVVIDISATGQREVEWNRVEFDLPRSHLRGAEHWRKPTFEFAETVAESFRLKQFFSEHLTYPFAAIRGATT